MLSGKIAIFISVLIFCIISYLICSVNFAIIFTKKFAHTDVREHGSGNAGMTNVMRTAGKKLGIFTFLGDFLKGTVSVLLGKYLFLELASLLVKIFDSKNAFSGAENYLNPDIVAFLMGVFCLLGHMFPIYFGFKGGKGVSTIVGSAAAFPPFTALFAFITFLISVFASKIVSISSIIAVLVAIPLSYIFFDKSSEYVLFGSHQALVATCLMAVMSLMVILKHHENIKRLIKGEEKKFSVKKEG